MSLINKFNFLRWDDGGTPGTSCDISEYSLPVKNGDTLKFQINFDSPIPNDISAWKLGVWLPSAIVIEDIATLSLIDVDGVNSNIEAEVSIGVYPRPWFRLVIYDTADSNAIKYFSNPLKYIINDNDTAIIKYRNNFNIGNYMFEDDTTRYSQFRIDCRIAEAIATADKEGYELSSGLFETSETIFKKSREIETFFFDEYIHAGFIFAINCDEIYFDAVRYYADSGSSYSQNTSQQEFQRSIGQVRLLLYDHTHVASNT